MSETVMIVNNFLLFSKVNLRNNINQISFEENEKNKVKFSKFTKLEEYLISNKFEKYASALNYICKDCKKGNYEEYSSKLMINNIIDTLDRDFYNKKVVFRIFYYMTNPNNSNIMNIWNEIKDDIITYFEYDNEPDIFKVVCKVLANCIYEFDVNTLKQIINNNALYKFEQFPGRIQEILNNDITDADVKCLGYLRIFSAFSSRYDDLKQDEMMFFDHCCIPSFILALKSTKKPFAFKTIKYFYFLLLWSPNEIILKFNNDSVFLSLLMHLTHEDNRKDQISFYSSQNLLIFSKLHRNDIANTLIQNGIMNILIESLPKNSIQPFVKTLFHICFTDEQYTNLFLTSDIYKCILNKAPNDLYSSIESNHLNASNFLSNLVTIFVKYPNLQKFILSTLSTDNIPYLFIIILQTIRKDSKLINMFQCINILIQMASSESNTESGLRKMFFEKQEDILYELSNELDDESHTHSTLNLIQQTIKSIEALYSS